MCPWSWALEPRLRRLHLAVPELRIRYVMAGMERSLHDAGGRVDGARVGGLVRSVVEAGLASGMPVDPRIWWEGPPSSSYPACIAVCAAAEQGSAVAEGYLRRLREGLLLRRRKLDAAEALVEEARAVPGLDVERFRIDIGSHAILEAFGADLERARAVDASVHDRGAGRVRLPSLEFVGGDGRRHGVYGYSGYEELLAAARAAGASAGGAGVGAEFAGDAGAGAGAPTVEEALRRFGTMATVEVAEICALPGPRAPAELWRAALEWRVEVERVGTGELWRLP